MTEELSLPVPEEDDNLNSLKDGFVMFCSFAFFGMLPILGFAVVPALDPSLSDHDLFLVACAITVSLASALEQWLAGGRRAAGERQLLIQIPGR